MEKLKCDLYLGEGYKENNRNHNTKELEEHLRSKLKTFPKNSVNRRLYERLLSKVDDFWNEVSVVNRSDLRLISRDKILCGFIEDLQPRNTFEVIDKLKESYKKMGEKKFGLRMIDNRLVSIDLLKSRQ